MFIYDRPIETEKDDFLGRANFSKHLGKALLQWKEKESLVVAIYGEWGSGKSSVINLASEFILNSSEQNKPTIIEFNPWFFSEQEKLTEHFFNEIAKELEIKKDSLKDEAIAKKLRFYASVLNLTPDSKLFHDLFTKIVLGLGLLGISTGKVLEWLKVTNIWNHVLFFAGLLLILAGIFKDSLLKLAEVFEKKTESNRKSVLEIKKEIKNELSKREKKLIITIDDIDRLNQTEIRQIFRLIRVNADFPNTIYLLAFERKIIEKNLEEQAGVSGKDYLDKIIQVNFDIPFARSNKIAAFLFKELDRVLKVLPESAHKYFGQDDPYWTNIYHSGFKSFFGNIRDVKRYIGSLEFNISQMFRENVMEVNPIDFIAIEAIRVFTPEFYSFMKVRNSLFTSTDRGLGGNKEESKRKDEIEKALDELSGDLRAHLRELISRLFPQLGSVFQYGYSSYGAEWQSTWNKNLRVCATDYYDSYFTLIPGGDEEELSQFEIQTILSKSANLKDLEDVLRKYMENKKIRKVLEKIQDYTSDPAFIPQSNAKNIVQALFNISDEVPHEKVGMYDFGADMDIMRIIYQILKREKDKNNNYDILKETIPISKGLYGPIQEISLESSRDKEKRSPEEFLVPREKIQELQKICLEKILSYQDKIFDQKNFLYIIYRWREWDEGETLNKFIEKVLSDDEKLILFLDKFITETMSQSCDDYGIIKRKKFNFKNLKDFIDLDALKVRLEELKEKNRALYEANKETVDSFMDKVPPKGEQEIDTF
jgi:predicted KAP-like P-loop ATPase